MQSTLFLPVIKTGQLLFCNLLIQIVTVTTALLALVLPATDRCFFPRDSRGLRLESTKDNSSQTPLLLNTSADSKRKQHNNEGTPKAKRLQMTEKKPDQMRSSSRLQENGLCLYDS
ncbi:hypothetical protein ACFFRR_001620 [Megaselia abdita]